MIVSLGLLACSQIQLPIGYAAFDDSYSRTGDGEVHTSCSADFVDVDHYPDGAEQARLRVQWGRAAMGHLDWGRHIADKASPWIESEEPALERGVAIRGSLQVVSEDGKTVKPVDWRLGVRVIVARLPNTKPDWSKRHDEKDSAWSDCVTEKDGSFLAYFRADEIRRRVGSTADFQVAICLGVGTWQNKVPVLTQTLGTVRIAGPSPLSPTLQAINGAPSVGARDFNPAMLVRAVNRLHALGKEQAIAELRRFLKISTRSFCVERDPANIDTCDNQCVFLIVRLLFEPAEPTGKRPEMRIGAMRPSPPEGDRSWPLFPLALQDDIPFILIRGVILSGVPEDPSVHVDWAEKHGKLRARPLRPIDDPLAAVESLCALPRSNSWEMAMLRDQAWKMVEGVAGPWRTPEKERYSGAYDPKADCEKHQRILRQFKIKWDSAQEAYVAR
jgi:hypothetical protein